MGLFFIIFNGALGIIYKSWWHGSICIYYILLTLVRSIIVLCQTRSMHRAEADAAAYRARVSTYTHVILLLLNIALIGPVLIMIMGDRGYEYGLVPAIAMAAYTFYRIVFSIINLKKVKKESNCLVRELRVINMIDTLVAILSLQNALIIAAGGDRDGSMSVLVCYSGLGIFALIVFLTVRSMVVNRK